MSSPFSADVVERDAALWASKLEGGGLTDAERERLFAWLASHPEHEAALSRYRGFSSRLKQQLPAALPADVTEQTVRRFTLRRRWIRASISLVAVSCVLALIPWKDRPRTLATGLAERRSLTLEDGTLVDLNAETELHVHYTKETREVTLTRGEASFQVARNRERPFLVHASAAEVRVTGTHFNVRDFEGARVDVAVAEGSVQVGPRSGGAQTVRALLPGDQARVERGEVAVRQLSAEAVQNLMAWRTGHAAFESEPLREALERFASYHQRRIRVSPDVAGLQVGGKFNLNDLDSFLTALEQILPVRVIRGGDGSVQVAPRARADR